MNSMGNVIPVPHGQMTRAKKVIIFMNFCKIEKIEKELFVCRGRQQLFFYCKNNIDKKVPDFKK